MTPGADDRVWTVRRALVALAAAALLAAAAIAGALARGDSGRAGATPAGADTMPSVSPTVVATRWWSVPGAAKGSRIDPVHPAAVAARLRPSRTAYCTVLRQTTAAGRSVLPTTDAHDPVLILSTQAFVGELTALAPAPVHAAWVTAGTAVLALVRSGGDLDTVQVAHPAAVRAATSAIAVDAKKVCHLDVSSTS